jgi:pSer/pThr/pTyr-binding forkhead associated (FHA) protein
MKNITFVVSDGPEKGLQKSFEQFPVRIGRGEDNHLILDRDPFVSRHHCEITEKDGQWYLRDSGSTHGTYLNGAKISEAKPLDVERDTISVGRSVLVLVPEGMKLSPTDAGDQGIESLVLSGSILAPSVAPRQKKNEALLVLDICSSTEFIHSQGDKAFLSLVVVLAKIIKHRAEKYSLQFMKCTGDGFFATFGKSEEALDVATYALRKVRSVFGERAPYPFPGLRIALHSGELYEDATGDRVGIAAHLAFRLQGATAKEMVPSSGKGACLVEKDRILATEEYFSTLEDPAAKGRFAYCGDYLFKGFSSSVRVYIHATD